MGRAEMKCRQNNGIQLLRAIACIFVVLCHTQATNIGSWGVDIFFVISGFMLMYSTHSNGDKFFWKRTKKIVPLYWFMTIVTSILICLVPWLFNSYEFKWEYLMKSLFFIPYQHNGIVQPVYGLGWTLNYEVFVYLVFGISMHISHKYRAAITSIVCIILTIVGEGISEPILISFYGSGVLVEFVAGMALYYIIGRLNGEINTYLCLGMILISFALFVLAGSVSRYLNIVFAVVAFVGAWKLGECMNGDKLTVKMLVCVGNASYCVYLTHIYAVRIVEKMLAVLPVAIQACMAVLSACIIGVIVYNSETKIHSMLLKMKHLQTG